MSNELLSTVSADEVRRLAELLECGMGCGPTERRAAKTLRALVSERDELDSRVMKLEGALCQISDMTYDSWTNGAIAKQIAIAALTASKGQP